MVHYPDSSLLQVWCLAFHLPLLILWKVGKDYRPRHLVAGLVLLTAAVKAQVLAKVKCGSILHDCPDSSGFEALHAYYSQSTADY